MDLTALYSMAEKLEISYVTAVVITGLSVVFLGLVILILFVWAFGKIFTSRNKPTPNEKVPAPKVTAPAPVTAPVNVSNDSEDENYSGYFCCRCFDGTGRRKELQS